MSFWSNFLPFVKKADADVEAEVTKIAQKASADVAALRARHAKAKVQSDRAAKVAAFEQALADYKGRLAADLLPPPVTPPTPTV